MTFTVDHDANGNVTSIRVRRTDGMTISIEDNTITAVGIYNRSDASAFVLAMRDNALYVRDVANMDKIK